MTSDPEDPLSLRELIAAHLAGELSEQQRECLDRLLRTDEKARVSFAAAIRREILLGEVLREKAHARDDGSLAARPPLGSPEIANGPAGATPTTGRRSRAFLGHRVPDSGRSSWGPWLVAAGVIVGFVALLGIFSSGTQVARTPGVSNEKKMSRAPEPAERKGEAEETRRQVREDTERTKPPRTEANRQARNEEGPQPKDPDKKAEPPPIKSPEDPVRTAPDRADAEARGARAVEDQARSLGRKPPSLPSEEKKTQTVLATLEEVEGEVYTLADGGKSRATAGQGLTSGHGLAAVGSKSRAVLRFPDQTRLELAGEGRVEAISESLGKRVHLGQGTLVAEVAKQPAGRPMAFLTPHAEATILGTTLRIVVDPDKTRLEVEEGRVRFRSALNGKTVDVPSGHYAVAAVGTELSARRSPITEILLTSKQGKVFGTEWRWVADAAASTGHALEVRATSMKGPFPPPQEYKESNCVTFEFNAVADQNYYLWIRARTIAKEIGYKPTGMGDDAFVIEIPEAGLTGDPDTSVATGSPQRAFFDGYSRRQGYWWIGGAENEPKESHLTVRFRRAGRQTLRIYGTEPPVRVDAIWLSATQKTRPEASQGGPLGGHR